VSNNDEVTTKFNAMNSWRGGSSGGYRTQTKDNPEKANDAKYSKIKLVAFYDTHPGNMVGLFYKAPESTFCYISALPTVPSKLEEANNVSTRSEPVHSYHPT